MSVLKNTASGPVSQETIKKEARIPHALCRNLLQQMQIDGSVNLVDDTVEADANQRLQLAVKTLSLGGDLKDVTDLLSWQEFEAMASLALERSNFNVTKNLHFKQGGRRWEIDVVGLRKPLVTCLDCKHWHHGMSRSVVDQIAENQMKRTQALSKCFSTLPLGTECSEWNYAVFVPVVLSLIPTASRYSKDIAIVQIMQIQDFINNLPANMNSLAHIVRRLPRQVSF